MTTTSERLQRAAVETAIDGLLRYIGTGDRGEHLRKFVDVAQRVAGDMYTEESYDAARALIRDNGKWMAYVNRILDEVDPHVLKKTALGLGYQATYVGTKTIRENRHIHQCNIPWLILLDPTSACNLHCTGCWAAEYGHKLNLTYEELDDIVEQGKALGVYFYMYTGGEPLIRKADLIRLCKKHGECHFHAFTNGTLVDEAFCRDMAQVGNLSLSLSLEGFEQTNDLRRGEGIFDKVLCAMRLLKAHGLLFGTSICYTSANLECVTSDEFLDLLIENGCRYSWYFHYMPVGNLASPDLMPSVAQREFMLRRIREVRAREGGKPIFLMDFQNDGEYVGGCVAGGRNYLHINANGDIEPCVFIHYSDSNIREVSLLDALKRPLFMAYRDGQPFNCNHLRPCPMLENPEILAGIIDQTGAKSTDLEAPESVQHLCDKCKPYAAAWESRANELWASYPHPTPSFQNYKSDYLR